MKAAIMSITPKYSCASPVAVDERGDLTSTPIPSRRILFHSDPNSSTEAERKGEFISNMSETGEHDKCL